MIPPYIDQITAEVIEDRNSNEFDQMIAELCLALASKIPATTRIISLDGMDGVGKTTIGRALAEALQHHFIDIDDYLEPNQGSYFSAVNHQTLTLRISQILNSG